MGSRYSRTNVRDSRGKMFVPLLYGLLIGQVISMYTRINGKFPRQSRTFVREYLDPAYYKPVAN